MSIIKKIEQLEEKGLWQSATIMLKNEFESSPNKEVGIRLLFVCWYVLIEWGCLDANEEMNEDLFVENLKKVTTYLIKEHLKDVEVNFYLGYMVSLSAWYFSQEVKVWENRASHMLAFAAQSEPDNAIFQMVHLANIGNNGHEYKHYCELAYPIVNEKYSGDGEFNLYFRQVLSRKI